MIYKDKDMRRVSIVSKMEIAVLYEDRKIRLKDRAQLFPKASLVQQWRPMIQKKRNVEV